MKPIILIPARLKSTRLPDKPLALIAGTPMIVHVWRRAKEASLGPVYVACDDTRIKEAIEAAGGKAIMTRDDHTSGSDRIYEALLTIDPEGSAYDTVINVQGDVPTIEPALIRAVLEPLKNPKVDIATLACRITDPAEEKNPAIVKPVFRGPVTLGALVQATSFTRNESLASRPFYHHIGIYAYKRGALMRFVSLPQSPLEKRENLEQLRALENRMRIDVAIVDTVPLGVDTPEQLEQARKIMASD